MGKVDGALMRWVGISFVLLLTSSIGLAQGLPEQRKSADQQPSTESQNGQTQLDDKAQQEKTPSSTPAPSSAPEGSSLPQSGQPASMELPQSPQPQAVQETPKQQSPVQPGNQHKPIGAAAAEKEKTSGIAASNPAGVAIAPAKQGRGRAFFIKVGAVLGAGVAVGTAMALSRSSPSRPPGSH